MARVRFEPERGGITVIEIAVPGAAALVLREAVFDLNGTLAKDGHLLPGVPEAIAELRERLGVTVLTAGTFGGLDAVRDALGVEVSPVATGEDKARHVRGVEGGVVAVGNGTNDRPMFEAAALAICVLGPEGAAVRTLSSAHVVVGSILDGIGLLLEPRRLVATLRP